MRLPLPTDFFAPVQLSAAEVHDLQRVEARLLSVYLASYDAHVDDAQSGWKLVGQRAGVKIFRQRPTKRKKAKRQHGGQLEPEPELQLAPDWRTRRSRTEERELPALRLVGSVDGTLEDVLYGAMWRSGRERAARAHFTGDGVADGAVLCSVETPSSAEPFRSLSVKWALKRAPHGGLVVKDRDFCYLAAAGVVHSPRTGVKLGYRLRHSITFPSCPSFQNHSVVRGQIFLCSFFRQLRNGRVEVFHGGKYDVGGGDGAIGLGLPKSIAEKSIVETLLSLADVRACALAKKLAREVENTEAGRARPETAMCGMSPLDVYSVQCTTGNYPISQSYMGKRVCISALFLQGLCLQGAADDASKYASRDANGDDYEVTSGRWGHDDIPEEDEGEEVEVRVPTRRHSMVPFSGNTHYSEVDELSRQHRLMTVATGVPSSTEIGSRTSVSRLSAKQISIDSDAMNTVNSSPPDNRRRRSATLAAAPAHLMECTPKRERNWASSTSALSLQSPQRHVDGSPIVNINRRRRSGSLSPSVHRVSFGSNCSSGGKSDEIRVRIVTPKRSQPAAAYTPYFASAGVSSSRSASVDSGPPSIRTVHNRFFRDLYGN
ncbi:START-like domain [Phytophthora cactorum]|nr:START-like domain [Phytophthora cactorum]